MPSSSTPLPRISPAPHCGCPRSFFLAILIELSLHLGVPCDRLRKNSKGFLFFSINAGTIRCLVPPEALAYLPEFVTGKKVIVSRGKWPDQEWREGVEVMIENSSDTPFALRTVAEQLLLLPEPGEKWRFTVWTEAGGKVLEFPCKVRRVKRIPFLKPWKGYDS